MKLFLETRPIDHKLRNFTITSSSGDFVGSKILLDAFFSFFNAIEDDSVSVPEINEFGLDLLKLSHGDINSLDLNSNSKIIQYILQADYLLVSVKFIYELCDKLLTTDNNIEIIFENYHRLYSYIPFYISKSINHSGRWAHCSKVNLEDKIINYFIHFKKNPDPNIVKYFSFTGREKINKHFKCNIDGPLKYNLTDYRQQKIDQFSNWNYENPDKIEHIDLMEKLINYRSLESAVFFLENDKPPLYSIKPYNPDNDNFESINCIANPPKDLKDLLERSGILYFMDNNKLYLGDPKYKDEKKHFKFTNYPKTHEFEFLIVPLYITTGKCNIIPFANESEEAKKINLSRFVYDVPDNLEISGFNVPIREFLIRSLTSNLTVNDIPEDILESIRFFLPKINMIYS